MTMINADKDALLEQVELLKAYADQGRSLPLTTGAVFIVWGLAVAVSGMLSRDALLRGNVEAVPAIWIGATVIGWLTSIIVKRVLKLDSQEGAVSHGNQVAKVVWLTAGGMINAYAYITIFIGTGLASIPIVSMLISGLAFNATAAASTSRMLYIPGVGYICTALSAIAFRWNGAEVQLAIAMGALLFLAIPGLYLVVYARSRA